MIRSDKKLADLNKVLKGGKNDEIEEVIGHIRENEPFQGAIMLLALFYDSTDNEGLKVIISGFFNDVKEKSVCKEVIDSIAAVKLPGTKAMLASSCWQSGLDYSDHALALTEYYLEGDYITSLECFTVLDICSPMINEEDRNLILRRLEEESPSPDNARSQLTRELISALKER
jgi:hypothetical protein